MRTWGSEPCHAFALNFSPPEIIDKRLLPKIGERGVVGVVGAVDSLGASSDVTDSGGGDGLWRNCLRINLGNSSSALRSSTPTRIECKLLR